MLEKLHGTLCQIKTNKNNYVPFIYMYFTQVDVLEVSVCFTEELAKIQSQVQTGNSQG